MYTEVENEMFDVVQNTMLIVDDLDISREILSLYFEKKFTIMEAANGKEALEILKVCNGFIDIILLDLSMPKMGGKEFLDLRKNDKELYNIPVIVITASQEAQDELETFELGIDDYVTKPFLPEIVDHRVQKILNNKKNYTAMLNEKQSYQLKAEIDMMTGLYNKSMTETAIEDILQNPNNLLHAMIVIDIDRFKKVNDTDGHLAGDKVIIEVANVIAQQFRKSDIVGRIGGDEFVVLLTDLPSKDVARKHARNLIRIMKYKMNLKMPSYITLSIGIAYNDYKNVSYYELFEKADQALYYAKNNGKNQYQEYGLEKIAEEESNNIVVVYNSSRTICSSIEEVLRENAKLIHVNNMNELSRIVDENFDNIKTIFVDVSDEIDEGTYIWKNIESIKKLSNYPIIAIFKEGNLIQCKKAIEANVFDIIINPIESTYLRRRLDAIPDSY